MIRAWTKNDPKAEATARKVLRLRVDFIGEIFEELGLNEEEIETRTLFFVGYRAWVKTVFDWMPEH